MITLRPDQERALEGVRAEFRAGKRAVLLQAPTGWGKGTVAARALANVATAGKRAVFACHRQEINLDLVNRLRDAGAPSVRVVAGDLHEGDANALVTVVSVQTLDARELVLDPEVLWWDEAHRAAANSYKAGFARHPRARHVGATATPARADGKPLDEFEAIVQGPQVRELLALGLLAPIRVFAPAETAKTLAKDPAAEYPIGAPGVVFAASVEHSRALAAQLQERGVRAAHVDGESRDRAVILERFADGDIDVLVNYRLLVEGVDLVRAEVCMLASLFSSAVAFLQSIGRVRRPKAGRTSTLLDLCGSVHLHGLPDADRSYHLSGDAIQVGAQGEPLPPVTQCRTCLAWGVPRSRCEQCGTERPAPPPPRILAKDLIEQRAQESYETKQAALRRFVRIAVTKGRNPWSATHHFKGVYGEYPPREWMLEILEARAS